jgi:two-component sensor histidine kinase
VVEASNTEGVPSHIAIARSPVYGWTVSITVPVAEIRGMALQNLWVMVVAGALAIATTLIALAFLTRHRREVLGLLETQVAARTRELSERDARQQFLINELDHRAKNLLAVVQSIVRLTRARDLAKYRTELEGRIAALANAHSVLSESRWDGADVEALVRRELRPFIMDMRAPRATVVGRMVTCVASAAQPLAIVLHELATNSAKYGALSAPRGHVTVSWEVRANPGLLLSWREAGGPRVVPPQERGMGLTVIEQTVRLQLGGAVLFDWEVGGLTCTISLPSELIQVSGSDKP